MNPYWTPLAPRLMLPLRPFRGAFFFYSASSSNKNAYSIATLR
jgi:hypothetical protein